MLTNAHSRCSNTPADLSWARARSPTGRRCHSQATSGPAAFPSAREKVHGGLQVGLGETREKAWWSRAERARDGGSEQLEAWCKGSRRENYCSDGDATCQPISGRNGAVSGPTDAAPSLAPDTQHTSFGCFGLFCFKALTTLDPSKAHPWLPFRTCAFLRTALYSATQRLVTLNCNVAWPLCVPMASPTAWGRRLLLHPTCQVLTGIKWVSTCWTQVCSKHKRIAAIRVPALLRGGRCYC